MSVVSDAKNRFGPLIAYFQADSEEGRARNTIAATVMGNIPFYPLYVAWIVGARAWPTLLIFLSFPLFALTPPAGRQSGRGGRTCLLAAGIADTWLGAQALGSASGVEAFYVPTLLLPLVLYRDETATARALMICAVAAAFALGRAFGAPLELYSESELRSLTIMNGISAACLSAVIVFLRWRFSPLVRAGRPATP